jgi:hypothetical protein
MILVVKIHLERPSPLPRGVGTQKAGTGVVMGQLENLRKLALGYPETSESTSCTKAAFKVRKKSFLYVGEKDETYSVMVKLADSLEQAQELVEIDPQAYQVGKAGWVTVTLPHGVVPPGDPFRKWTEESFRLFAPKKVLAELDS